MRYDGTRFSLYDAIGEYDPRGGGALPPTSEVGQVLYSENGTSLTVQTALTSCDGWLVNDQGLLLVKG